MTTTTNGGDSEMHDGFGAWVRRQTTFHNILILAVLISTFLLNTGRWVTTLTQDQVERGHQIDQLVEATKNLASRVDALERANLQLSDIVATNFPRRAELEPRLKSIEDQIAEMNRLERRRQEQYRR